MTYRNRPSRPFRRRDGLPAWLIFVLGAALVFGLYYMAQGVQNFLRTGGLGVVESTERAVLVSSATADRVTRAAATAAPIDGLTPRPTLTPIPECQPFVVDVPNAIVRELPNASAPIVTSFDEGTEVCVLLREPESEWYMVDSDSDTRRHEIAYMHETVIEALNPTLTPSITPTPPPTVTATFTPTITVSPTPRPTSTPDPNADPDEPTETLPPTPTPNYTPTAPRQTA